jgi:hypothetical protein
MPIAGLVKTIDAEASASGELIRQSHVPVRGLDKLQITYGENEGCQNTKEISCRASQAKNSNKQFKFSRAEAMAT